MEKYHVIRVLLLAASLAALSACDREAAPESGASANPKPAASAEAYHEDDGHDHEDHEHAPGDGHDHGDEHGHGAEVELGTVEAGTFRITARRAGDVTPGGEVSVDIGVAGPGELAAVRVWIGQEDGRGSLKARADREGDGYHAHVEVPQPLPDGSRLWIGVEPASGEAAVVSLPLTQ